jgi:hypothetical protein
MIINSLMMFIPFSCCNKKKPKCIYSYKVTARCEEKEEERSKTFMTFL